MEPKLEQMEAQINEQLLQKISDGDEGAFTEFYNRNFNNVYFHAKKYCSNEDDAQEAVQDIFLAVFTQAATIKDLHSWKSWLGGITHNIAISKATRNPNRREEDLDDFAELLPSRDKSSDPQAQLDEDSTKVILAAMIDQLPTEQRAALTYFYYDEMPIAEIAEVMGCSENTVKSRLNYAKQKIEKQAEALERKEGIKLYSFSPAMLLGALGVGKTAVQVPAIGVPLAAAVSSAVGGTASAASVAATASAAAAGTAAAAGSAGAAAAGAAGAAATGGLLTKTVAIIAACAVGFSAIGGAVAYVATGERRNARQEPTELSEQVLSDQRDEDSLVYDEADKEPEVPMDPEAAMELLSGIAYYGNRSLCTMPRKMAQAYADAIESMEPTISDAYGTYSLRAMLVDMADAGLPVLITMYNDDLDTSYYYDSNYLGLTFEQLKENGAAPYELSVWGYRNGKANKVDAPFSEQAIGFMDGVPVLLSGTFFHYANESHKYNYCSLVADDVHLIHEVTEIEFEFAEVDGTVSYIDGDVEYLPLLEKTAADVIKNYERNAKDEFEINGWSVYQYGSDDEKHFYCRYVENNGKVITQEYYDALTSGQVMGERGGDPYFNFVVTDFLYQLSDIECYTFYYFTPAHQAVEVLRTYAQSGIN